MLEVFFILALSFAPSAGINCIVDEDLDMLEEFSYDIPHKVSDLDYWRTFQLNYQVYGKFVGPIGDTKVTAGYYTADDKLIYSITIDCKGRTWKSEYIERGNDSDKPSIYKEEELDSGCSPDTTFDVWFKVHQPMLMSWLFNGQYLQWGLDKTYFTRGRIRIPRYRPKKIQGKYKANTAARFSVKGSGAARFTCFTFGKCVSWPKNSNCSEANLWVRTRSKLNSTEIGAGYFGANMNEFTPQCFLNTAYFDPLQLVHPDRKSAGRGYCCCVHMDTGKLVNDDPTNECVTIFMGGKCEISCIDAGDNKELIQDALKAAHG